MNSVRELHHAYRIFSEAAYCRAYAWQVTCFLAMNTSKQNLPEPELERNNGILPAQSLRTLIKNGVIAAAESAPIHDEQIQPASLAAGPAGVPRARQHFAGQVVDSVKESSGRLTDRYARSATAHAADAELGLHRETDRDVEPAK